MELPQKMEASSKRREKSAAAACMYLDAEFGVSVTTTVALAQRQTSLVYHSKIVPGILLHCQWILWMCKSI